MLKAGFITVLLFFLYGCAVERNDYSYGYYTGIKNPRVTRDPVPPPARSDTPATVERSVIPNSGYHHVEKGDTLYSIAWQYGHDVRDVANWNNIRAPYTIYPGDRIHVTRPTGITRKKVTPRPAPRYSPPKSTAAKRPRTESVTKRTKSTNYKGKITWQWPAKGKIISTFSARDSGKKGIDIAGRSGQRVYAAADGEIVYSGSGLRGYGKLIIIKHNDTYFSAYAHNKRLHVKEDQVVRKGQHIADMGSSETNRAMLHFEVRRNGKPVDPLRYLPKRR